MNGFKNSGVVLIYVVVIGAIMTLFISVFIITFNGSIKSMKEIKNQFHMNFMKEDLVTITTERYKQDTNDSKIYKKYENIEHSATRYKKDETIFLSSGLSNEKNHIWNFHKNQRELPLIDLNTETFIDNKIDLIKTFKVYWNMKDDLTQDDIKKYNSMQRQENASLRITLTRKGIDSSTRCFNTTNADVSPHILVQGGDEFENIFNNTLIVKEEYFKSATLTDDCTKTPDYIGDLLADPIVYPDPFEPLLLNNNGIRTLDFENNHYTLKIQALTGETNVRVIASGNNGYIPTNTLNVSMDFENNEEKSHYLSSNLEGVYTLDYNELEESNESYYGREIKEDEKISYEMWNYLVDKLK